MYIQILDENTANQIAAGEVVERPAAVVKELVENAIDAGATSIEIETKDGGLKLIRVSDNGVGMSPEDARMSVKRHATSKIRSIDDLYKIGTLGFRGEALPSIAAVSKFSLTTRQLQDNLAVFINIEGGRFEDIREAGAGCGTTVVVSDIFYNVPARRKFLKTPAAESAHISETVGKLALSHPEISFKLIQNKKLTLVTNGNGSLLSVMANLYGTKAGEEVLPVAYQLEEDLSIAVNGYIGKPTLLKSSRAGQTFIVNDRIVVSKMLFKALDNAYFSLLPKGGYPLVVLKISLDADVIDINVHPQKREVKFSDEQKIFKAVYRAVLNALNNNIGNRYGQEKKEIMYDESRPNFESSFRIQSLEETAAQKIEMPAARQERDKQIRKFRHDTGLIKNTEPDLRHNNEQTTSLIEAQEIINRKNFGEEAASGREKIDLFDCSVSNVSRETSEFEELYPLGQIDACYIVAYKKDGGGLYVIDQHAAHERILYEKFKKNIGQVPTQQLLMPVLLDFTKADCEALETHKQTFYQLGFSFEQVGSDGVRLTEIPSDIAAGNAESIIRQSLVMLNEMKEPTAQSIRHAYLQIASCRSSVKAGDVLTMREMQALLGELGAANNAYTCPHGRPAIVKFSQAELNKMFRRV
jgi:DNA mismatch repair protein MutL